MSSTAPVEVRQCSSCQAPAVTLVFTWTHTTWGANTGAFTREFRCQNCGKKFTVRPKAHAIGVIIAGALLLITCVGIPFIVLGWWRLGAEKRIPVVPGAPPPLIRFRGGPPLRTCGECSGTATAMRITRHTHNGIPTGTEYEYVCAQCQREFTVESALGQSISVFGGLLCAAGAIAFLVEGTTPAWKYGGGGVCALLALFLIGQAFRRFTNRLRNPAQPDAIA